MTLHAGILYRAGAKILLMKRRPDDHMGGTWAFPAGKIEDDETPVQAAIREFYEETGKLLGVEATPRAAGITGDFELFEVVGNEFIPTINDEHTQWQWCDPTSLPEPLHPNVAMQIAASSEAMDYADTPSARELDRNGYVTINRNPITRAGVFQYAGRSLPGADDPDRIYNVYRPLEELTTPEALKSMALLPIINEHEMLGDGYQRAPEDRGVHGATGEDIVVEGLDVLAPIRIFSRSLKQLVESGKKGISLGYRCTFEKIAGEFNGMRYDYIQKNIRGNHLALVNEGRSGTAVLDHHWACDSFDLALDNGECSMADEDKKDKAMDVNPADDKAEKGEPTIAECMAMMEKLMPLLEIADKLKAGSADVTAALDAEEDKKDCDKAEDADEEEEKKDKPADKAEDEDDEKEKDAMDTAEIKTRLAAVENRSTVKSMRAEIAATDALARRVASHVGTFDHSAMDEADVVAYGVEKLGIKAPKGAERVALDAYLDGLAAKKDPVGFAMDMVVQPKQGGLLAKRINRAQA